MTDQLTPIGLDEVIEAALHSANLTEVARREGCTVAVDSACLDGTELDDFAEILDAAGYTTSRVDVGGVHVVTVSSTLSARAEELRRELREIQLLVIEMSRVVDEGHPGAMEDLAEHVGHLDVLTWALAGTLGIVDKPPPYDGDGEAGGSGRRG